MSAKRDAATGTAAVDAFMAALNHPRAREIAVLRATIRGAAPGIEELVKWNGPSFRRGEDFATIHWRDKNWLGVILHRGAKAKDGAPRVKIDDANHLLEWLSSDRAIVKFATAQDVAKQRKALAAIVKQWVRGL